MLLSRLAKLDLLVIDDLGIGTLKDAQRQDLLEVIDDRYGRSATIITSQLPLGKWHEWVADPTLADAVLDRLVHNAYKLDLKGPSRRKEKPSQT
jgi:DNA replication protein DnaC